MTINQIHNILLDHQIPFPPRFPEDGKFTRWGKKKRFYLKIKGGRIIFGDWANGIHEVRSHFHDPLSYSRRKERQLKADLGLQKQYEEAARKAETILAESSSNPDFLQNHKYIQDKEIIPYYAWRKNKDLILPLRDSQGKLWSIQRIPEFNWADKKFLKDSKTKGCFHLIGESDDLKKDQGVVLLCEGYATGVTLYMATDLPVVVTFSINNIESVYRALKRANPNATYVLAADNNQWKQVNAGKKNAQKLYQDCQLPYVLPTFNELSIKDKPTDFNDLYRLEGIEVVAKQILTFLEQNHD